MFKQSGFSYIEATMITAIIGIVAAISIPAYLSHLDRAKFAEAYTLIASKQSDAIHQLLLTGYGKNTRRTLTNSNLLENKVQGKYGYVTLIANGEITYTFTDQKLSGNTISVYPIIAPDGATNWQCRSKGKFPSNPCQPFQ